MAQSQKRPHGVPAAYKNHQGVHFNASMLVEWKRLQNRSSLVHGWAINLTAIPWPMQQMLVWSESDYMPCSDSWSWFLLKCSIAGRFTVMSCSTSVLLPKASSKLSLIVRLRLCFSTRSNLSCLFCQRRLFLIYSIFGDLFIYLYFFAKRLIKKPDSMRVVCAGTFHTMELEYLELFGETVSCQLC